VYKKDMTMFKGKNAYSCIGKTLLAKVLLLERNLPSIMVQLHNVLAAMPKTHARSWMIIQFQTGLQALQCDLGAPLHPDRLRLFFQLMSL
jgi:hypothetical protein